MKKVQSWLITVTAVCICASLTTALDIHNITRLGDNSGFGVISKNGEVIYITKDLMHKLLEEEEIWHWTPWLRTRTLVKDNVVKELNCSEGASIDSFPTSIFTDDQLWRGGFICYVMFGIYAFTLLAIVCNDFFIPCVEIICEDLKIPQNVAAATFMAVATSCPEFFVNLISTFLTQSDMGIGTIVGSAIFNALGVAAIGGLSAIRAIPIEAKPVTRDVLIYMFNVTVLFIIVWDGQVAWYEALVLGVLYICYFIVMFNSIRLFAIYDKIVAKFSKKGGEFTEQVTKGISSMVEEGLENKAFTGSELTVNGLSSQEKLTEKDDKVEKPPKSLWRFPSENSLAYRIWFLYTWPLKFVLSYTIPSPVKCRRFYPLTFLMCIIWIGVNSYFVTWSMTVIGYNFFIPDSVMGMTFLAFGGCLPEACSIFIMSRRGEGGIGVSNALGANSLAILFALGFPWLVKTLMMLIQGDENAVVFLDSAGIGFVIGSLLVAVACLWITLFITKFTLRKSVGFILLVLYVAFIIFAVLVEIGIVVDIGETC